ncbi:MAG: 50S ribosomal protein L9 [Waddliaceae bacterium]
MAHKILLLEDVRKLGRKGDVVSVRPGFARNYLIPNGVALRADKHTLRLKERLEEERKQKAVEDRTEAEGFASKIDGTVVSVTVKVDPAGHMYGSVSATDAANLLSKETGLEIDKSSIDLKHPIKKLGDHSLSVLLKEDVKASFTVKVVAEGASEIEEVEAE